MTQIGQDPVPAPACDTLMSGHTAVVYLPLDAIRVEARFRRELGDIASLAASIDEVGLLHPIVVTPDYRLIAGERRLAAFRQLGRPTIPVRVLAIDDIVRGEFAENVHRADFTPSEMVAIGAAVEPLLRVQAKERQTQHGGTAPGKKTNTSGKLPGVLNGQARDQVARYCGVSGRSYEKAKAVVAAAEREPERFGGLVELGRPRAHRLHRPVGPPDREETGGQPPDGSRPPTHANSLSVD